MTVWSLGICRYAGGFMMFYGLPCNNHRHGKYGKCSFKSEYHPRDVRINQDKGFWWDFSGKKALRFVLLSCWPWVCRCCVPTKRQVLDVCVQNAWSKIHILVMDADDVGDFFFVQWCFNVWTDASDGSWWIMVQLLSQLSPQVFSEVLCTEGSWTATPLTACEIRGLWVFFSFLNAISQNLAP